MLKQLECQQECELMIATDGDLKHLLPSHQRQPQHADIDLEMITAQRNHHGQDMGGT